MKSRSTIFFLVLSLALSVHPVAAQIGGGQGWITISCNVDGASVSFDGNYQGITSGGSLTVPVYVTAQPFHSFTVEKAGFTSYSGPLSMPAEGQTLTYYAAIDPVYTPTTSPPYTGSVSIDSSPRGATVYFNGNNRGLSPVVVSDVIPGSYSVDVELDGYQNYLATVNVYQGTQSAVFATLVPQAGTGSLYITSDPGGSSVFLDGLYEGVTPLRLNSLAAGTHTLQLDHTGYYDWKSPVTVPTGGTTTITGTLNPLPASNVGWIYISTSPGGAAVTIDGNPAGRTPANGALQLSNIPAGVHSVSIELGGYRSYLTTSTVTANTVSEVSIVLQPIAPASGRGSVAVSSVPPGANVFLDNIFTGVTPLTLSDVSEGNHIVTVQLAGFGPYSASVQVAAGTTSTVSAPLSPATPAVPATSAPLIPEVAAGAVVITGLLAVRKNS